LKIGVLALQGDAREHMRALDSAGATPREVRTAAQLEEVDALIVPGGESTTIGKLLDRYEMIEPLKERATDGMPLFGTCAGLILMANEVVGGGEAPHRLSVMDVEVRRNAYGRQVDSFESELNVSGFANPFTAVFIRAPVIERVGGDVEILATCDDIPVLVRQGHLVASSFHPEMTGDARLHDMFVEIVRGGI
jgi:pyridoxal 5'-phosphate synthase pdxT subunit